MEPAVLYDYLSKMPDNSIYTDYFTYAKQYSQRYGDKTIVLMQVGAFFEVYGVKNMSTLDILYSEIVEFAEICQLNISEKTQSFALGQIVMAGFRDFTLDKYLSRLTDNGYTAVVYVQEKRGKDIHRVLDKVYSPGTYVSCDTDSSPVISNYIMCVWLETYKSMRYKTSPGLLSRDTLVYGVSVVNIFTGESSMFQHETPYYLTVETFDELERYVSVYTPSEILIISPFDERDVNTILQFSGIQSKSIHILDIRDNTNIKVHHCSSQKYISEILSHFFGEEAYAICNEFETNIIATQSLCYLLNFIQEHNSQLIKNITLPVFNNTSNRMVLANHTLRQLNIIGDLSVQQQDSKRLSSVLSFLNKCCSPMGRRKFQYQLTNPSFDVKWLNMEYNMIGTMLRDKNIDLVDIRKHLMQIRDLDKLCRQLLIRKIYPSSIYHLYLSMQQTRCMTNTLKSNDDILQYLCGSVGSGYEFINKYINEIIMFLETTFELEICKNTSSLHTFTENIIKRGISSVLDNAMDVYEQAQKNFNRIHGLLNTIIQERDNTSDVEYVKVHETEKSGLFLQITMKRSQILKSMAEDPLYKSNTYEIIPGVYIKLSDIRYTKSSASNYTIELPILSEISRILLTSKIELNQLISTTYLSILETLERDHYVGIERISQYIANIDVLQSKTYVAKEYNYCEPILDEIADKSYIIAGEIRHCLIEHIQQNELYVVNDIALGIDGEVNVDGILLYGTNAVGKTSLIRALGIAVIMAQAGMYVPCTSFKYKPYTAIFSRILGNDNLFKGLSTFAVEMSELRVILKMADQNSLILGDELCSGTETESALSIFAAGLMNLHTKRSSFIFATHFHEIIHYDEITKLDSVVMKHMSVSYNRELDCLVYDRKLKDGSGPRTYGLEVCKSLYMDESFLNLAYSIRNKYYPDTKGVLSYTPCVYNANKLRSMCEMCGMKMSDETHHLHEQQFADNNGFIGTFHKNHKANLLSVCEECHNKIHNDADEKTIQPIVRKKTTKGYKLSPG